MKLKISLFFLGVACAAAPVMAAPVNMTLTSGVYICSQYDNPNPAGRKLMLDFWQVTGPSPSQVSVTIFRRTMGDDRWSEFKNAPVDASGASVIIPNPNGVRGIRVNGLLDGNATGLQLSGQEQNPKVSKYCSQMSMHKTADATALYDGVLKKLANKTPTAQDLASAENAVSLLPPVDMLSPLDQQDYASKLKTANKDFITRYYEIAKKKAADPKDTTLLPSVAKLVTSRVEDTNHYHPLAILRDIVKIHAKAMMDAGMDPITQAVTGTQDLCARIDGFTFSYNTQADDYFAELTDVPVDFWTKDQANKWLSESASCNNGAKFKQNLMQNWKFIQTRMAGMAFVKTQVAQLKTAKVKNLDDFIASDWLMPTNNVLNANHVQQSQMDDYLMPAIRAAQQAAVDKISAQIKAHLEDPALSLSDTDQFCSATLGRFGNYFNNQSPGGALYNMCNKDVAPALKTKLLAIVSQEASRLQGLDANAETFFSTNGFTVTNPLSTTHLGYTNADVQAAVQSAVDKANATLADNRSKALAAARATIDSQMDPAISSGSDIPPATAALCKKAEDASYQVNMSKDVNSLAQHCSDKMAAWRAAKKKVACTKAMVAAKVPDALKDGYIEAQVPLLGMKKVTVRELVCQPHAGDEIDFSQSNGWFSSSYKMTHKLQIGGHAMAVTATVTPTKDDTSNLVLSDLKAPGGTFNTQIFDLKNPKQVAGCFFDAEDCVQPN
ncbi:hypothetical protein U879_07985 [Defluviimonas sp. 20V17]|nr:hypothetical protein U879_07985 [Defluviimonas sp. 20V17]